MSLMFYIFMGNAFFERGDTKVFKAALMLDMLHSYM